jgi:exosortase/archaeosortase family protein
LSSIVALLALGTLIIYMSKGNVFARLALVVLLTPIAILSNGFRVGSMLLIAFHFGGDAGLMYHDTVAGFISWAVALALLFIGLRITRCRFSLGA